MTGAHLVRVDPSNTEQARAWDGDEGRYWATHAERFDDALARYHQPFLDAAAIGAGARILDIGCGTGQTTRDAARRAGSGMALGIDLSSRMIEVASRLAERQEVGNARFDHGDAQVHPFPANSFDLAISRTGAMFFGDPVAAFTNITRALRPGGRLVLLVWQPAARNEWLAAFRTAMAAGRTLPPPPADAAGPFSLSDPGRTHRLLTAAGFSHPWLEPLSAPLYFGRDADDAYPFVLGQLGWMLRGLDDTGRTHALDALRATVEAHATDDGVWYGSAAWIVTAQRP
ncbi:MAG: class I SAM-dependent methyltransferase [Pseudonocardiaceae bacterium]